MSTSCHKLYYFVHLDSHMHPIPGTMFGKPTAASNTCTTLIAPLTGNLMVAPAGQIQCIAPNRLRYWYQVKNMPGNSENTIVPNSMIAVIGVPGKPAGRSCDYVEFKTFKTAS